VDELGVRFFNDGVENWVKTKGATNRRLM